MGQQSSKIRDVVSYLGRRIHVGRPLLYAFPGSLIMAYGKLPEEFVLRHLQQLLPFQTRWALRYWLRRMEDVNLVRRVSRKTYRKSYGHFSNWVRSYLAAEIERLESGGS